MSNKIRHGRGGQKVRRETGTHMRPPCGSERGLALGRARRKKWQHKVARRGLRPTQTHGHWKAEHRGHQNHGRVGSQGWMPFGKQHPWKRELENDERLEANNDNVACSDEQHG